MIISAGLPTRPEQNVQAARDPMMRSHRHRQVRRMALRLCEAHHRKTKGIE
jgi:hypothetical protein